MMSSPRIRDSRSDFDDDQIMDSSSLIRELNEAAARSAAATVADVMQLSGTKVVELQGTLREAHERTLRAIERAKMSKRLPN